MTLGLDIEGMALQIVSEPSPNNRRQTVRKVNATSSKGSVDIGPSFTSKMFNLPLNIEAQQSSLTHR